MKSKTYWQSLSDRSALSFLGAYIRHTRISQNKTQASLAVSAGVHRETILQIEKGDGGNLSSFIRILRMLSKMQMLETFEIDTSPTPIQLATMMKKTRQRASRPRKKSTLPHLKDKGGSMK